MDLMTSREILELEKANVLSMQMLLDKQLANFEQEQMSSRHKWTDWSMIALTFALSILVVVLALAIVLRILLLCR